MIRKKGLHIFSTDIVFLFSEIFDSRLVGAMDIELGIWRAL